MDRPEIARTYYRALDEGAYDRLESVLAPEFVHDRPDRTLDGRAAFLTFMRSKRPQTDTHHPIDAIYEGPDGVVATGRLQADDGSTIATFADRFRFDGERIEHLRTYTC